MALIDYTTLSEVRAALGVSIDEIPDSVLTLPMYEVALIAEMKEIAATFRSQMLTIGRMEPVDRSEAQSWFYQTARLFATYSVARHLTTALPLFSPKEIADGKAHVTRYSTDPYRETVKGVRDAYSRYRTLALAAFSAVAQTTGATATLPVLMVISSPDTDPVTGS